MCTYMCNVKFRCELYLEVRSSTNDDYVHCSLNPHVYLPTFCAAPVRSPAGALASAPSASCRFCMHFLVHASQFQVIIS